VYVTYGQAPHLELHIGAVKRVYSTFITEFSVDTHNLEVAPKPWDSTTEERSLLVIQEFTTSNGP
jgi:hypothetical protein